MALQRTLVDPADPVASTTSVDLTTHPAGWELTTVTTDSVTLHRGEEVEHHAGLSPGTAYELHGLPVRTLDRPAGVLRSRFATVNDVHFGETEAGRLGASDLGPIKRSLPGMGPYPEVMNTGAVAEIAADELDGHRHDAVFVKGDLTGEGTDHEFEQFARCYAVFDERLHVVRGNHDGYLGQDRYSGDQWVELDGVAVALLDTVVPYAPGGALTAEQLDWLDAHAAAATVPLIVLGHHPIYLPESPLDQPEFLLDGETSTALQALIGRRRSVLAYAAGHTHRQRVRALRAGGLAIEIACVKDFPGVWAAYDVYDGGIVQTTRRISTPEALRWSEECRGLYADFGVDYTEYALGTLADRCRVIPLR